MRYFYLLICCCFTLPIFGQEYRPMLKEGARWNEYVTLYDGCNYTLKIAGDTLLNGVTYKKIKEDPACGLFIPRGDFRYLREDTLERKLYEGVGEGFNEIILYDFSLSVGDTFHNSGFTIVLDSISTIIDNPFFCGAASNNIPDLLIKKPRVFYFNGGGSIPAVWIEGVGSLSGLFSSDTAWSGGDITTILCYENLMDGQLFHYVYCREPVPCRSTGLNAVTTNNLVTNNFIKICPNPANDFLLIELLQHNLHQIINHSIYDATGRLLINQNELIDDKIDVSSLSDGVYFLEVTTNSYQKYTHKFIKI